MEYMDFLDAVCDHINESAEDVTVSVHSAVKNNGVKLSGITFGRKGYNASPTIYMENYYTEYQNGSDIDEIAQRILALYNENSLSASLDMSFFDDFESVRDRLYIKLINRARNEEFLKEAPHEDFLDLAIVAYVRIYDKKIGNGIIMVRNEHARMWGKDGSEILEAARKNTHDHDGFCLRYIVDVLESMGGVLPEVDREHFPMYVATNKKMTNGAAVLVMKDKLKDFARIIGNDYYVIPSSVHELILLGKGEGCDKDEIDRMIRDVNEHQVGAEEVLSDHVYMYRADDEVLIF